MNVQQLLFKLSEERLERYIQAPVWRLAKERGLSWQESAKAKEVIQEAAHLLTPYAAAVLKEMLRLFAAVPVEGERLINEIRMHTTLSGAECQLGVAELEEAGILFSVRKVWGESLYFVPLDCFAHWQQTLFPCTVMPLTSNARERLMDGVMRPFCRPLGRQLLSAFSVLARSGLELTERGTLSKKTVAKLVQAVDLEEQWLKSFELKWAHQESYPLTAAFILEAASALGLLRTFEGTLQWDEDMLGNWLKLEEEARDRQLRDWCFTLFLSAGAASAHVAAALYGLQAGLWYSEREMEKWLDETHINTGIAAELNRGRSEPSWFGLFHSMGWLELVDCNDSGNMELLFRWKSTAPFQIESKDQIFSENHVAVQPNGELIVDPECPFQVRWELELIAERKSEEQVAVYRLEAVSIARALEQGRTRAGIQSFLQQVSGGEPLTTAVEALLEVWTSRACRTEFAEVVLLRCDNEQMAAFVEKDSAIACMLLQKLGSLDFIVDKSKISEIRSLLQKAGYPPRKAVKSGTSNVDRRYPFIDFSVRTNESFSAPLSAGNDKPSATSYIYEPFPLHHFELTEYEARKKMQPFSQMERVPLMWTKQLRAYHHSTRKELIEQALQWQTPVQLRMERELRSFVPERLEHQDGGWAVVGLLRDVPERQLIRLTPDMWDEMRLVIPDHVTPI